jgi:hypothetical protein
VADRWRATLTVSYAGLRNGVAPDNSGLFPHEPFVIRTKQMTLPPSRTPPVADAGRANLRRAHLRAILLETQLGVGIPGQIGNANILTAVMSSYGSYTPEATRG